MKAEITDKMKAYCRGYHSFEVEEVCLSCAFDVDSDIECMCEGSEDHLYMKEIQVPWDTIKEIYKQMFNVWQSEE